MRKYVSIGTVALLALAALAVGVGADAGERRQTPEGERVTVERVSGLPAAMERLERVSDRISARQDSENVAFRRVRCTTVQCLNRQLTRLTRFAKQTAKHLDKLDRVWSKWYDEWNNCVPVSALTQYDGYMYTTNGTSFAFPTTALDYTEEGDPTVSDYVLVWTCGVVE